MRYSAPCPFAKGHAQLITQNLLEIFLFFERSRLFARFFLLLFRKFAIRSDCSAVPASLLDSFLVTLSTFLFVDFCSNLGRTLDRATGAI